MERRKDNRREDDDMNAAIATLKQKIENLTERYEALEKGHNENTRVTNDIYAKVTNGLSEKAANASNKGDENERQLIILHTKVTSLDEKVDAQTEFMKQLGIKFDKLDQKWNKIIVRVGGGVVSALTTIIVLLVVYSEGISKIQKLFLE